MRQPRRAQGRLSPEAQYHATAPYGGEATRPQCCRETDRAASSCPSTSHPSPVADVWGEHSVPSLPPLPRVSAAAGLQGDNNEVQCYGAGAARGLRLVGADNDVQRYGAESVAGLFGFCGLRLLESSCGAVLPPGTSVHEHSVLTTQSSADSMWSLRSVGMFESATKQSYRYLQTVPATLAVWCEVVLRPDPEKEDEEGDPMLLQAGVGAPLLKPHTQPAPGGLARPLGFLGRSAQDWIRRFVTRTVEVFTESPDVATRRFSRQFSKTSV